MNPKRVRTREEVEALLRAMGLEPTDRRTETGVFWKLPATGRHVQVPDAYEGMYPEFIIDHLRNVLEELGLGRLH